jgi:Fe2+ transport system protein FeoA
MTDEKKNSNRQNMNCDGAISLTALQEGQTGILAHTFGGYGIVRRLAEMGLTPGIEVKLIRKCPFHGPLQVEVRGVAVALGYGVAAKVFVRPLKANQDA